MSQFETDFKTITGREYQDLQSFFESSYPNDKYFQVLEKFRESLRNPSGYSQIHGGGRTDFWSHDLRSTQLTLVFGGGEEMVIYEPSRINAVKAIITELRAGKLA